MIARNALYYGRKDDLPERRDLRAGPLSVVFEQGDLRYIRLGAHEMVRRIYVAVRDHNWGTAPAVLANLDIETTAGAFRISYDCTNQLGDIDFVWHAEVAGDAGGTITFSMDGIARCTFLRNRIGFCVLHPMRECAGQPCVVEHADGTTEDSAFPLLISPHQPFYDMRAIAYPVVPGVRAEVRFSGDIFEMEDQRNWTDASFKTYCTPLRIPYPAEVKAGTRITQTITLSLQMAGVVPGETTPAVDEDVTFELQPAVQLSLPRIGLGMAGHGQPLSEQEITRLKALNLSHLRVDLNLYGDVEVPLHRAIAAARGLGTSLEAALFLTDGAAHELEYLGAVVLPAFHPPVCTWLIYHTAEKSTSAGWIELARSLLGSYDSSARFGSGTNAYFTELNRTRPPAHLLDLVSYSVNPQVHAFDNASLVETLPAQGVTVQTAREFARDCPVAVSPVTLKPRFNPDASGPEPPLTPGELPAQVDVRQMSLFGAGWTLGSLKYLAESGCYSVTYHETTGWRGVMETAQGSLLPDRFQSTPGAVFPMYHVFADVGEFAGGHVIKSTSTKPLEVDGIALEKDGRRRVLVANLTAQTKRVTVYGLSEQVLVRMLDETNAEAAMQAPETFRSGQGETMAAPGGALTLSLHPFTLACIDLVSRPNHDKEDER
ncbi:MAG: hypothetical protein M1546_21385 [Chloroflexi bacterium]|nr:hypothetical protein [Chloroflexota bacterium]